MKVAIRDIKHGYWKAYTEGDDTHTKKLSEAETWDMNSAELKKEYASCWDMFISGRFRLTVVRES